MAKLRKMLTDINAPYLRSLMASMDTQSVATIARWCTSYAGAHLLPLWVAVYPEDGRPQEALAATQGYLAGEVKLAEVKKAVNACRAAARESAAEPVAQGAAQAMAACAAAIYNPAGALGLALYGSLALAYTEAGTSAAFEALEPIAARECAKMEAALWAVSVEDEPEPAKIRWNC